MSTDLLARADLVLFDFDGPLARLFPGGGWLEVSAQVRQAAIGLGGTRLAEELGEEPDHVQCLRIVGRSAPELLAELAALCSRLELESAAEVDPWPAALPLLQQLLTRGARVAVVTNNDPAVVPLVLDRAAAGLTARLSGVYGRSPDRVDDLKPAPDLLLRALTEAAVKPVDAVFLGDSVTDVEAGRAAGVPVIGVAETAERRSQLRAAGAVAAVAGIGELRTDPAAGADGPAGE